MLVMAMEAGWEDQPWRLKITRWRNFERGDEIPEEMRVLVGQGYSHIVTFAPGYPTVEEKRAKAAAPAEPEEPLELVEVEDEDELELVEVDDEFELTFDGEGGDE